MKYHKAGKNYVNNIFHHNCEIIIFMYVLITTLFAVFLFLYGFFPMMQYDNSISTRNDIPTSINHTKVNKDLLYKPLVQKMIIMVIDALRWDFVNNSYITGSMPITSSLLRNKSACLLQVKVNAPTVTMPRIKAMTTGAVSSFIDVAFNFGKAVVSSDNILLQAKNHGHKLIFYGDDTWLKLYPNIFSRYEGTTSFFVSDYTEVDNNVTRHISDELNKNTDWSIMILHYLGLDHIGHLYGPQSSLVKPKLQEMDRIIGQIIEKINQWNEKGVSSMLIVCGDHGMKDSGGHGGSTPEETLVPLIAYGTDYSSSNLAANHDKIEQIDIAATIAMMLGLPLPSSNLGSVSIDIINTLPFQSKLFMLHYNAVQVFKHFEKLPDYESFRCYFNYISAIKLHSEELKTNITSPGKISHIVDLYYNALKGVKNILVQSMIHYNLAFMNAAILLMLQALLIILNSNPLEPFSFYKFFNWWIATVTFWFLMNYLLCSESNDIIEVTNMSLIILVMTCFTLNSYLFARIAWKELFKYNFKKWSTLYSILLIVYGLSLTSSSFIEEEHQTWYFFWITFLLLKVTNYITEYHSSYLRKLNSNSIRNIMKMIFMMIVHRVLRKLNSTGNKYANLPDIRGWIESEESSTAISVILLFALGLLFLIASFIEKEDNKSLLIFHLIVIVCIYQRHVGENTVMEIPFLPKTKSIQEVQIFWNALALLTIYSLWKMIYERSNTQTYLHSFLLLVTKIWIFISAFLHRPYNVILIPMQLIVHLMIFSSFQNKNNENNGNKINHTFIHFCLGNVFYFYQGNSNSLATVDISAGYVGLNSYNFYLVTLFLCINTFAAPILSYLMLLCHETSNREKYSDKSKSKIHSINQIYTIFIIFIIITYTIIISFQRYHLFVWTVFSPKLLYVAVHSAVFFSIIILTQLLDGLLKK
ncbi:GPI ethanolamine phosphate transferase 2 isoform X2 [Chelonus insularis]|uniref:GPI ethanolamine phosphate transferase 2 isoform X2 n=1 Tax=Chelonus insularis TaxID=460826 RepID=UPI00158F396E|nr:GPI ethanolamine phosphate transferase 2 isoform X2 [Chelonus insularis]